MSVSLSPLARFSSASIGGAGGLLVVTAIAQQPTLAAALNSLQAARSRLVAARPPKRDHRERAISRTERGMNHAGN